MRRFHTGVLLALAALTGSSCVQILGGERAIQGEDRLCDEDGDCDPSDKCWLGLCRQRCAGDEDCGEFRTCLAAACSDPAGTPCNSTDTFSDFNECGGLAKCLGVDAEGQQVLGYCAPYCGTGSPCPGGYACAADFRCRCQGEECPERVSD